MFAMTDREGQRVSARPGSFRAILKLLAVLAAIAVAMTMVFLAWGDTGAATSAVHMRIFFVGWALAALVISTGFLFRGLASRPGWSESRSALLLVVQHVAMGFVVGLAVGTTDWTALRPAGWWQLWWTVPLLLSYAGLLFTLRRGS